MNRFRVSAPLLLTAGAALVVIVALTLAGWLSTERPAGPAAVDTNTEILSTAFGISRSASSMVTTSASPTDLPMTPESLTRLSAAIAHEKAALQEQVAALEGRGYDERVARIRRHAETLVSNIELIESGRPDLLRLHIESQADHRRINYDINKPLAAALQTSLDDQLDRIVKGDGDPGDPSQWTSNTFTADEALRYHHLFNLVEAEQTAVNKMKATTLIYVSHIVAMIREDYDAAAQRIETSIEYLTQHGPKTLDPQVIPLSREMLRMGGGEENVWDKLDIRLEKIATERALIAGNQRVLDELLQELDALVMDVSQRADAVSSTPPPAVSTPRIILLVIGIVGVVGTLLAAGYFGSRGRRN